MHFPYFPQFKEEHVGFAQVKALVELQCPNLEQVSVKLVKLKLPAKIILELLTRGNSHSVLTERVRPQEQVFEMRLLRRIEGVTLFNKVRSSEAECLRKDSPNKLYLLKQMGEDQLDNLELL